MARESQQYAPTFFTGFLKNSHKKDMMIKFHKDDAIHSSTYNRKKKKKREMENVPVLKVRVVLANCWNCK